MKKMILIIALQVMAISSFAQAGVNDNYEVMVGKNKNSAAINGGMPGFRIKGTDIRIVGFLYRSNKIAYDELYIETTLDDSIVVDSQVVSCCGISAKWRDFYLTLSNVKYSYNYRVTFYTNKDRVRLAGKTFFIKKDYD